MPPPTSKHSLKAVGCYVFAGGFTVGVKKHFDVLCHLEGNNYGVPTAKLNFPGMPIHVGHGNWPQDLTSDFKAVGLIYGNPPCAAWSGNNPKSSYGYESDPRVNCTRELFGLLEQYRPKVWVWESVCNAPVRGKPFVDELTARAIALGYSVTQLFHDAQYLGVPQTRKRWFMVCHRVAFTPAEPTWEVTSAAEALAEVEPVGPPAYDGGRLQEMFIPHMKKIKPGTRLRSYWDKVICPPDKQTRKPNGHVKGRVGFGHVRLKDTGPATATVGYSMWHPTEPRCLCVNEVQAVAGFPQSFKFIGGVNGAQQLDLIARGVCPPVGEWVARAAAEAVKNNSPVRKPCVKVYDFRNPPAEVA